VGSIEKSFFDQLLPALHVVLSVCQNMGTDVGHTSQERYPCTHQRSGEEIAHTSGRVRKPSQRLKDRKGAGASTTPPPHMNTFIRMPPCQLVGTHGPPL